ncbi:MAG: hypothetical protein KJ626_11920 [Verrucomicrobia bacterium]|nr:hypothetical protein [Verrucomicrobiota bacterium]
MKSDRKYIVLVLATACFIGMAGCDNRPDDFDYDESKALRERKEKRIKELEVDGVDRYKALQQWDYERSLERMDEIQYQEIEIDGDELDKLLSE